MRILLPLALMISCKGTPTPESPPDCTAGFADRDGDGFGSPDLQTTDCVEFVVDNADDCDDGNFSARPGADEICDGLDNDCDTLVDAQDDSLAVPLQFPDLDGDGFGTGDGLLACDNLEDHVEQGGDCDDDPAGNPDAIDVNPDALEVCDGIDNNCSGLVDDEDPALDSLNLYYADADFDGFGAGPATPACEAPPGTVQTDDDCDDTSAVVYPDALEICDNLDQNCDGAADAPFATPDPCAPLEAPWTGTMALTLEDGSTVVTCSGTVDLTLDRSQATPVEGTFECTVDTPQNGWAADQAGSITGIFREDGTLAGSVVAFEGETYDWAGTITGTDLTAAGSGLFISSGAWDLAFTWDLVFVEVPP